MATTDRKNQIQSIGTYLGDIDVKPINDSINNLDIPKGILWKNVTGYGEGSTVKFTANLKPSSSSRTALLNDDLQYYGTPIAFKVGDKTHFFMKDMKDLSGMPLEGFLPVATMQPNRSIIEKIINNKVSNITKEGEAKILKSEFTEVDKNEYPAWISKNNSSVISVSKNNEGNYRVTTLNDEEISVGVLRKNNISQHYEDSYFNSNGDQLLTTRMNQEIVFEKSSTGKTFLKSIDEDLTPKKAQLEGNTESRLFADIGNPENSHKEPTQLSDEPIQFGQQNVASQPEKQNIVVTHREQPNSHTDKLNSKNFDALTPVENPLESNIPVGKNTTLGNVMNSAVEKGADIQNINCLHKENPKTLVIRCADAKEAEAVKNALKEKGVDFKEVEKESTLGKDNNMMRYVGNNTKDLQENIYR